LLFVLDIFNTIKNAMSATLSQLINITKHDESTPVLIH